jgi:serine palmitoyltransferase
MARKSASKPSTTSASSTLSTIGKSSTAPHGRSSSFSKTSSKLTSFFSPNRSTRSTSPSASPNLSVPSIRVSPPGAEYEPPRPSSAPEYSHKWQEEAKKNAQFGSLVDHSHRHVSRHPKGVPVPQPVMDEPPYFYLITTYISYLIFIIFGHVRDFFGKRFKQSQYAHLREQDV